MRSFKDALILLVIVFCSLFLVNTGVMYFCFGINTLKPVERENKAADGILPQMPGSIPGNKEAAGGSLTAADSSQGQESAAESAGMTAAADKTGVLPAGSGMYMTAGEVQSLGELGLQDKLMALSILSQLGPSLSDKIYDIAYDGVTYSEMEEIRTQLEGKLSQANMDTLYGILDKSRKLYADRTGN